MIDASARDRRVCRSSCAAMICFTSASLLSSPLLLESGQNTLADYVVVVDVPEEVQLKRTMARDDNSEALVNQIMAAQLDRQTRLSRADASIMNDTSLEELYERVEALHEDLLLKATPSD